MSPDLAAEPVPLRWAEEGRVIRLEGSRISIDCIVELFNDGVSPERIVGKDYYPHLDLGKVYAVIAYYLRHKDEVDAYIAERERRAVEIRRDVESHMAQRAAEKRAAGGAGRRES